jgi:hypothetical protein
MDAAIADPAIKAYLTEIRRRLDEAARIAKAAEVCAQAGSPDEAVTSRWTSNSFVTRRRVFSTRQA